MLDAVDLFDDALRFLVGLKGWMGDCVGTRLWMDELVGDVVGDFDGDKEGLVVVGLAVDGVIKWK